MKKQKTIPFSVLQRMSLCNSPKIPKVIEVSGKVRGVMTTRYMEWVGIGYIELDPKRHDIKNPVLVIEDR